ncbi:MAG: trigger factor, partial [Mailhella sp.]|nr:trigger factor [Mailhella sp.]
VNAIIDSTIKSFGKDLSLDGFRKGKVPAKVIEGRFGDEILSRATDTLVNNQLSAILEENDINPVNRIQMEGDGPKRVARNTEFGFTCFFEVLPKIDLPEDLSTLSVEVEGPDLKPAEVEQLTRAVRRRYSTLEDVAEPRKPVTDDVVLVDIEGTYEGKPVPGMSSENFLMQLKDESAAPEVEGIVRTLEPGQEGTGTLVCPEAYPDPALRGKTVDLKVKLHKISEEKLPDMDEEFAKKVGFEDLGKLRKAIFEQALSNKLAEIKNRGQQKLLDSVIGGMEYPLPPSMLKKAANAYLVQARDYLKSQGVEPADMEATLTNMQAEADEQAKEQVKAQCFLMALGFREKVQVTEQDANRAIQQIAQQSGQEFDKVADQFVKSGAVSDLQEQLMANKALELMYNKAHKIVVDENGNPLPPPEVVTEDEALKAMEDEGTEVKE